MPPFGMKAVIPEDLATLEGEIPHRGQEECEHCSSLGPFHASAGYQASFPFPPGFLFSAENRPSPPVPMPLSLKTSMSPKTLIQLI